MILYHSQSVRHAGPRGSSVFAAAFTLVEILVSLAVLTILLLVSAQVIGQVQSTWAASNARVSQFREARTAFDIITRNLSQATLNTYIDYKSNYLEGDDGDVDPGATVASTGPGRYIRKSDLQFRCGPTSLLLNASSEKLPGHAVFFQAPLGVAQEADLVGLDRLLCGRGYFVQYSDDRFFKPEFLKTGALKYRYRLMEFSPPAEKNLIYSSPPKEDAITDDWYALAGAGGAAEDQGQLMTRPVADNILTLIISPQVETGATGTAVTKTLIAPQYAYNSAAIGQAMANSTQGTQHLLPPLVRIVLVAIDERSAERLSPSEEDTSGPLKGALSAFSQASQLDDELETLQAVLRQKRLNFRVFSAVVQLRGSKWST